MTHDSSHDWVNSVCWQVQASCTVAALLYTTMMFVQLLKQLHVKSILSI